MVLITNARCYSATDIFAAGFQDHRIGPVLGTDENTGAGGANVWTHALLSDLLQGDRATPYRCRREPACAYPSAAPSGSVPCPALLWRTWASSPTSCTG
ncbi:S41 family peptidase [Streptomyces hirsutus]|uniref:S41 family peptidase n=1 Tax=Streptomyces hirsutus TaxID=35620 RepID=UPI0036CDA28F